APASHLGHGGVELFLAIALQRAEDLARHALRMDPDGDRFRAPDVAVDERDVLFDTRAVARLARAEHMRREGPVARGELRRSEPPRRRLGLRPDHPLGDVHLNLLLVFLELSASGRRLPFET